MLQQHAFHIEQLKDEPFIYLFQAETKTLRWYQRLWHWLTTDIYAYLTDSGYLMPASEPYFRR